MYWTSPQNLPPEPGMAAAQHTMSAKWVLTDRRNYIPFRATQLCFQFRWFNISHQKQLLVFQYCNWFTLVRRKAQSIRSCLLWSEKAVSCSNLRPINNDPESKPLLSWEIKSGNQSEKKLDWLCQLRDKESHQTCSMLEQKGQKSSLLQCPTWHSALATITCSCAH